MMIQSPRGPANQQQQVFDSGKAQQVNAAYSATKYAA
jgi:hypothetical protein